jgi:pimeloyl-ACP methyl ester carboxylesterase
MIERIATPRGETAGTVRLDRRTVVGGTVGAAAAELASRLGTPQPAAAQDGSPTAAEGGRATFVLVPGAWAGAWIWRDLIRLLRDAGHDVYAVTLTGLGDRAHLADPAIDRDVYITDVVNLLEFEELRDVTLVGHSSGGTVITEVAERVPERLAQLVYLDASVPTDGQNDYNIDFLTEDTYNAAIAADIADGMAAGLPGFRVVIPGIEEWIRGSLQDPAVADWVISKLTPQPLLTFLQPVRLGNSAAAALPRAFIACTEDPMAFSTQTVERVRSDPNWRVVEVADNHLALINNPQLVAEALVSLV